MSDKLLLDTCALLWLTTGEQVLSLKAIQAIKSASVVYVSPISAWEISLKFSKQEIALPEPPLEWFYKIVKEHNLKILPLTVEILIKTNELPWHHRDPADRMTIAGTMLNGLTIVTRDRLFQDYDVPIIG